MNTAASRPSVNFNIPSTLLRRALLTDATLTALTGIGLLLAGSPLSALLNLPTALLRTSGMIFVLFAALVGWLGTRPRVNRPLVFVVIAVNALWALDSVLLLFTGWVTPTALGVFFVIAQALFTGVMAEVEFIGLRRSTVVHSYAPQ